MTEVHAPIKAPTKAQVKERAKAQADASKISLEARLSYAKQRLAPRSLAARGADVIADRAASIVAGAKPAGRVARALAPALALTAIAVAVLLRLKDAEQLVTTQPDATPGKPLDDAPVEDVFNV
jgi:hypothetical protein